jgi:osmotically-inducible protein OsmY
MTVKSLNHKHHGPFSLEEDCFGNIQINTASNTLDDKILEASILRVLNWNSHVPVQEITITVKHGYVIIDGLVPWQYQKINIASMVKDIKGVKGITNNIGVVNLWTGKLLIGSN